MARCRYGDHHRALTGDEEDGVALDGATPPWREGTRTTASSAGRKGDRAVTDDAGRDRDRAGMAARRGKSGRRSCDVVKRATARFPWKSASALRRSPWPRQGHELSILLVLVP